tara:strand:+ start:21 stop:512 length:492 start_codon:yes stop_codon:yes gene_type:complete
MGFKINKIFLLSSLILLQSCSGGRIGNFLESSFKNIEEPRIKENPQNNFKNKIVIKSGIIAEKNKNIKEPRIKENPQNNFKNKILKNADKKLENYKKNNEKNKSFKKRNYQPQSYKIIFILKDVDPKDPTEDLRTILRNSDVNFEIEKIERFLDPKNKSIKTN